MEEKIENPVVTPAKKRIGRPPGSKNKAVKRKTPTQRAKAKVDRVVARAESETSRLDAVIAELRNQIVGYRAVISYLENQLGLKKSI